MDRSPNFEEGRFSRWPKLSSTGDLNRGDETSPFLCRINQLQMGLAPFWLLYATDKEIDLEQ